MRILVCFLQQFIYLRSEGISKILQVHLCWFKVLLSTAQLSYYRFDLLSVTMNLRSSNIFLKHGCKTNSQRISLHFCVTNCTQTVQTLPDKGMQCQNLTFFAICLGSYWFWGPMSTCLPYCITVVCAQHIFSQRCGRQCSILHIWGLKRLSQITEVIFMLKEILKQFPFFICAG